MREVKKILTRLGVTQLQDDHFKIPPDPPRSPNAGHRRRKFIAKTWNELIDKPQRHMTLLKHQLDGGGATKTFRDFANWCLEPKAPESCSPHPGNDYIGMLTRNKLSGHRTNTTQRHTPAPFR